MQAATPLWAINVLNSKQVALRAVHLATGSVAAAVAA